MAESTLARVGAELSRTLTYLQPAAAQRPARSRAREPLALYVVQAGEATELLLLPQAVNLLAERLQVEQKTVLDVSRIAARTFLRRLQKAEALSATETDRLLRVARLARLARDVLGDEQKAQRWLSKPHPLLGDAPLRKLGTDAGAHEVEAELQRIQFGDFA